VDKKKNLVEEIQSQDGREDERGLLTGKMNTPSQS
jgi:hypothetical protein